MDFASRQCNLKGEAIDPAIVIGAIRASGRRNLAVRCERLLDACAGGCGSSPFGGEHSMAGLKHHAVQWLNDWQAESRRQFPKPCRNDSKPTKSPFKTSSRRSSASAIVIAIALAGSLIVTGQGASAQATESFSDGFRTGVTSTKLNGQQQKTLLDEANNCYNRALEKIANDSAEAKQGFADAADKYQLLVNDGVSNSRLYFNLGNAYLESGRADKAIANYLRCLRIDPTMHEAQTNLTHSLEKVNSRSGKADVKPSERTFSKYASTGNQWLNSYIRPRAVFVIMVFTWFALWTTIGLRVVGFRFPWKSAVCASILLFILAATSCALNWQSLARQLGVIIQSPTPHVENANASVANVEFNQGQVVEILQQRGNSTRIRSEDRESTWLPTATVEAI